MIHLVKGDIYTNEPLAFLPEDASIKEEISPYYMARIVDFPAFIAQYPFKKHSMDRMWLFTLEDPMMKYNQGTFLLKISRDGPGRGGAQQCAQRRPYQYSDYDYNTDGL